MGADFTTPRKYDQRLFVNRETELEEITSLVEQVSCVPAMAGRVIPLAGQRGIGKTWLLQRINEQLEKRFSCVYLDIAQIAQEKDSPDSFIRRLLERLTESMSSQASKVDKSTMQTVPLERWSEWLVVDIRRIVGEKRVFVLLVDSVYESKREFLDVLERYVLAPLAVQEGVVIIMAGYGPYPLWRARELYTAKVKELEPFNTSNVESLLTSCNVDLVSRHINVQKIHELTGGYPLSVGALLKYFESQAKTGPEQQAVVSEKQAVVKELMDHVLIPALDFMLKPLYDALGIETKATESFLERWLILAALRVFDEDRLTLAASPAEAQQMMDQLLTLNLIAYRKEKRGYVLDKNIHHLWGQVGRHQWPDKWCALHQKAAALYEDWSRQFPQTARFWDEEAAYHRDILNTECNHPER